MINYFIRWLRVAFTHSPGIADFWIGAITALITVADHWRPGQELAPSLAWQIPIWVVVAVVALRLILAPYWISEEDTATITRLNKALDDKEAKEKALKQLWALRRNGVILRNEEFEPTDHDTYARWNTDYQNWRQAVLIQARTISVNLENWLETLNEVDEAPRRNMTYYNDHYKQSVSIMSEMLRRIEAFLQKEL